MNEACGGVLGLFPTPGNVGGVERSGLEAWQAITSERGAGCHLICYQSRHSSANEPEAPNSAASVHCARNRFMALAVAASRKWPVRLVLVWHLGMLKLLPVIRTDNARTALFLHGIEAWANLPAGTARLLRRVDLFLTNSDFTWQRFIALHPELSGAAHCTVPLGLGDPLVTGSVEEPANPPVALMIGRIASSEAYKGHAEVIAAWPTVAARFPGAKLRMIGPCDMTRELRSLAEQCGVCKALEIAGAVTEEVKQHSIAQCGCMALPSRGEGFGLAYLESMRMGRPCVVSTFDAGREVVCPPDAEAGGMAVDPGDSEALAGALIRLMTPGTEWDRWSAASKQLYDSRYTAAHFGKRLLAALDGLL